MIGVLLYILSMLLLFTQYQEAPNAMLVILLIVLCYKTGQALETQGGNDND